MKWRMLIYGFVVGMATMAALDDYMYKHQEKIVYVPAQLQDMKVYTCYNVTCND